MERQGGRSSSSLLTASAAATPLPSPSANFDLEKSTLTLTSTATTTSSPSHVKDRGLSGWLFVLGAALSDFIVWGSSSGYGSFQTYHQHNPASPFHTASLTAISSIGTSLLSGQFFVCLFTFGLYTLFPAWNKVFTYICVVGYSVSLVIASFANSIAMLVVFQGILPGLFGGNLFLCTILWLPQWFDKKRGLATGLIFCGSAVGGIVWPSIFTALLSHVGFRSTLRTCAVIQLVLGALAVAFLKPAPCAATKEKEKVEWKKLLPAFPRSLVNPLTMMNIVVMLTQTTVWYTVGLNIANYTSAVGYSDTVATATLSAFNATSALTYCLLGYLVDRFAYPLLMAALSSVCVLLITVAFGFARDNLAAIFVFVALFGTFCGGFDVFVLPIARDIKDDDDEEGTHSSLRFLYLLTVRGVAAMVGPIIGVQFYPATLGEKKAGFASYAFQGFIAFNAAGMAVAALFSVAVWGYKRRQKAS